MAIITVSRGCFSHGKEIAEKVAKMLDYECISQEILFEASQFFHMPETRLMESLHDAPSVLEKITHGHEKLVSYIQAALLEHVKRDNVVYHGYAGHRLIPRISHVLKIRVIAEMEDRIALLQEKEALSRNDALRFIEKEDKQRADWNHHIFKANMDDPRFYDIMLNIGRLTIDDACDIICTTAKGETYKTTFESNKALHDLALGSHVKAVLQGICQAEVISDNGTVHVKVPAQKVIKSGVAGPTLQKHVKEKIRDDLMMQIVGIVGKIPGVKGVSCDIDLPDYS